MGMGAMAEQDRRGSSALRGRGFGLREWPLRRKLALALAIPVILAATFGTLRVRAALSEADSYSATATQITVLAPAASYLAAAERAMITARQHPGPNDPERQEAVTAVQAAGDELRAVADRAELTPAQWQRVDSVIKLSEQMRTGAALVSQGSTVAQIRQLQRGTAGLIDAIVAEQIEPDVRFSALQQALDGRLSLAMQLYQVSVTDPQSIKLVDLSAELGVEQGIIDRLGSILGTSNEFVRRLNQQNAAHFGVIRSGGHQLSENEGFAPYDDLTGSLLDQIGRDLNDAADAARTQALRDAALTLGALLLAIILALLIARSLLVPIRRLREGVLEVANVRLPAMVSRVRSGGDAEDITPIPVDTHEEMGQLARAVDAMHRQAVQLASGEARLRTQVGEMFSTLSRRNASLINQQLGLIERLEKDEQDPRRLESLFRLDHLATRMRRTGDSLLVLADVPARNADNGPLALGDVFQAAIAGVQEYQRVQIDSSPRHLLHGSVSADVVHLLTELIDNALAFSPPTAPVRIDAAETSRGVLIEVGDGGLGIAPDVLDALNDDLRSGGEITAETTRRMGLLVVSRLAKRHGIHVSLARNSQGGTTASVILPSSLLRDPSGDPQSKQRPGLAALADAAPLRRVAAAERREQQPDRRADLTASRPDPLTAVDPAATATAAIPAVSQSVGSAMNSGTVTPLPRRSPGATRPGGGPAALDAAAGSLFRRASVPASDASGGNGEQGASTLPHREPNPPTAAFGAVTNRAERSGTAESAHGDSPAPSWASATSQAPSPPPSPASAYDMLDSRTPMPESTEVEPPIFRRLRSSWFSAGAGAESWTSSPEVEAGWRAAERVAEASAVEVSESGLPMRRPGKRLMPGGVSQAPEPISRDPEAIRARLAAHAAGVSRGRSAAAEESLTPRTPSSSEEGPA